MAPAAAPGAAAQARGSSAGGNGSTSTGVTVGATNLSKGQLSGLGKGLASLSFKVGVAKRAAKLDALTVELPAGMGFVRHRVGGRLVVRGVTLIGARIRSLSLSRGHLVIVLRRAVRSVIVKISAGALKVSTSLKARARANQLRSLRLTVIAVNTSARRTTIHVQIKNLGL